jgi:Holliday junction resolvase RusA-like endonuclease
MLSVMTVLVDVDVPGAPVPAPRPRVTSRGTFLPKRYTDAVEDLRLRFLVELRRRRLRQRYDGPVKVDVTFATTKGDVDNLAKTVLDALNGVVLVDDRQVLDLHAKLVPARGSPSARIKVETLGS